MQAPRLLCHEGDDVVEKPLSVQRILPSNEVIKINGYHPENMTKTELARWVWYAASNYDLWYCKYQALQERNKNRDRCWYIMGTCQAMYFATTFLEWILK